MTPLLPLLQISSLGQQASGGGSAALMAELPPGVMVGKLLDAMVEQRFPDGRILLALPQARLEIRPEAALQAYLPAGAQVSIKLERHVHGISARLVAIQSVPVDDLLNAARATSSPEATLPADPDAAPLPAGTSLPYGKLRPILPMDAPAHGLKPLAMLPAQLMDVSPEDQQRWQQWMGSNLPSQTNLPQQLRAGMQLWMRLFPMPLTTPLTMPLTMPQAAASVAGQAPAVATPLTLAPVAAPITSPPTLPTMPAGQAAGHVVLPSTPQPALGMPTGTPMHDNAPAPAPAPMLQPSASQPEANRMVSILPEQTSVIVDDGLSPQPIVSAPKTVAFTTAPPMDVLGAKPMLSAPHSAAGSSASPAFLHTPSQPPSSNLAPNLAKDVPDVVPLSPAVMASVPLVPGMPVPAAAVASGTMALLQTAFGLWQMPSMPPAVADGGVWLVDVLPPQPHVATASADSSPALPVASQARWPALAQAVQLLQSLGSPQAAQFLQQRLPQIGPALLPSALFYLQSIQTKNIREWMGEEAITLLEQQEPELAARLSRDFANLQQPWQEPVDQGWQSTLMPLMWQGAVEPAAFYLRRQPSEKHSNGMESHRFMIDLDLSHFGPLQLDGFFKQWGVEAELPSSEPNRKQFSLVLRSIRPMEAEVADGIRHLFITSMEAMRMQGSISIRHDEPFVQAETPPNGLYAALRAITE